MAGFLTSRLELPRLARISSSSELEEDSAGLASDGRCVIAGARNRLSSLGISLGVRNGEGLGLCQPGQSHAS